MDLSCMHDLVRVALRSDMVEDVAMLLDGLNHVALLTGSTERFVRFYSEVFGAEALGTQDGPLGRLTFVRIGPHTEFNLFEVEGNTEAERQTPMFGRGRLDHFGLQATSIENFEEIRQRLRDHVDHELRGLAAGDVGSLAGEAVAKLRHRRRVGARQVSIQRVMKR